jgi:nucleoside phosphorylase
VLVKPRILICGATRTEAEACRQGIKLAKLENRFEILTTGIGPAEAAESLKERLRSGARPDLIISSGFAGSWSSSLDVGTWISATSISNELKDSILGLTPITAAVEAHLISVPEIFETPPKELSQGIPGLAKDLPTAVDMESFSLAWIAQAAGIDFRVVRYVTDSPKHPLPAFVRHFTDVAVRKEPLQRMGSLLRGSRALLSGPGQVASFMKHGVWWRSELISGWARFALGLESPK